MSHTFPALRFLLGGSIPLLLLSAITAPPALGAEAVPVVLAVRVMEDVDTLEIEGTGFASGATLGVALGGDDITGDCAALDSTLIRCIVSGGLPAPGDYRLVVATRYGKGPKAAEAKWISEYDLTIGGAGPEGPKGDEGDEGPQGERGATGPSGPKGDPGTPGEKGTKGDAGTTGALGATGPMGPAGSGGGGLHGMKKFTEAADWTVPDGVTHVLVEAWGAGGGGGGSTLRDCGARDLTTGGGGGGSGSYSRTVVPVPPSSTIAVNPGAGGAGGPVGGPGEPGGPATIGELVLATGGSAGREGAGGGPGGSGGVADTNAEVAVAGGAGSNGRPAACPTSFNPAAVHGNPGIGGEPIISPYGLGRSQGGQGAFTVTVPINVEVAMPAAAGQPGLLIIYF